MKLNHITLLQRRSALLACLIVLSAAPLAAHAAPQSKSSQPDGPQSLAYAALSSTQSPTVTAFQLLGGPLFAHWQGVTEISGGAGAVRSGTEAVYTVPDGPKGSYPVGLTVDNDGAIDARHWFGVRFDVRLDRSSPATLRLTLADPPSTGRHDMADTTSATVQIRGGTGWQSVTVPFTAFDYFRGQFGVLRLLKRLAFSPQYPKAVAGGRVLIRNVRLVRGNALHLQGGIRSLPAEGGGSVTYPVTVTNCSDGPQIVSLSLPQHGWEGMPATVTPSTLSLPPGASSTVRVSVTVPGRLPEGAQETQTLVATPSGNGAASESLDFVTLRRLPSPYLVMQQEGWDAIRAKVAGYEWAKQALAETVQAADAFMVPIVPPGGIPSDQGTQAVMPSYIENKVWPCVVAWKLTGDKAYAEKVALFLMRLSDPVNGFPKTLHASSQGIPQEGGMFEAAARAYDAIRDAGVLSEADKQQIEQTLRLYVALQIDGMAYGGISNWSLFNLGPAAQCALAVQDMASFNQLTYGEGGIVDHMRYGGMDDGWWYEMSLSYNLGCADTLLDVALAAHPFGCDLLTARFPSSLSQKVGLRPFEYENFEGMAFGKFGPLLDNTISIKKFFDGIVLYPDYRGVMFGMGDGHEDQVAGGRFEKAYYAFRDPNYAAIIKQGDKRDLLYGVPDLPADTPRPFVVSGHSDNAGLAVLRSQTANRPPSDQIQVSMKYGTHGSYHGHFDRISLNSLERNGRSFWSPESTWYGYGSYMYKWWVQPSMAHNMVVVDHKMQEPKECKLLLFHSGPMMQAAAVETDARWSNPPYFGGYEQLDGVANGDIDYVAVPKIHPKPGDVTDYTEPVRQRRLIVVTDDYVILADDLSGQQTHTFDNLLHLRGVVMPDASAATFTRHTAQLDTDPLGSAQFITNVSHYDITAPFDVHSIFRVAGKTRATDSFAVTDATNWETGGAKSLSEPGVLNIDERVLWPQKATIAIGDYPEAWFGVHKKLTYDVAGDGKSLTSGTFGAWNLGAGAVDVDVTGLKTLTLSTTVGRRRITANGNKNAVNTIFWGSSALITTDGKAIPLSTLKPVATNILPVPLPGLDYAGGPVTIAGTPCANSVAAEPSDPAAAGTLTYDLSGLGAVRFKASVGGDWPVGNEEQVRKTVSVQTTGTSAHFLTLIEPYETTSVVKSATATGPESLRVELTDGHTQEIAILGLASHEGTVSVTITETAAGKVVRTETAVGVAQ